MRLNKLLICSLFIAIIFPSFVHSQMRWDLRQCIDYALEHSLSLKQEQFNIQDAKISEKTSVAQRLPSLNGNTQLSLNFGRTIDPTTNEFNTVNFLSNTYGLNSSVVLFNGSRINNSIKQARLDLAANNADLNQAERDLALNVSLAYLNVLFAQENLNTGINQVELSQSQLEQIDKLIEAGSRPRNERLDILAQLATNEQTVVTNENNVTIAMLNLKQVMNLDPSENLEILEPDNNILIITDPDKITFDQVFVKALSAQPQFEAMEQRIKSAELGIDIAKSALLPSIGLGGNIGTNYSNKGQRVDDIITQRVNTNVFIDNTPSVLGIDQSIPITSKNPYFNQIDENISYGFGVQVSIPIYNNYQSKASIERAKLNVLRTENQNEQLLQNLKTNVQQVIADARSAKKQLDASQKTFEARKAALENAQKRYELSAISTYDFLSSKNQFDAAQTNLIIAKYDYLFRLKVLDFYQGLPFQLK